jgi:hypothetical protein
MQAVPAPSTVSLLRNIGPSEGCLRTTSLIAPTTARKPSELAERMGLTARKKSHGYDL